MKTNIKNSMLAAITMMAAVATASAHDFHRNAENGLALATTTTNYKAQGNLFTETFRNDAVKPFVRVKNQLVSVNILNLDASAVKVSVLDKNLTVLHTEVLKGKKSLGTQFDFSNVKKGEYTIVVEYKNKKFFETVKL